MPKEFVACIELCWPVWYLNYVFAYSAVYCWYLLLFVLDFEKGCDFIKSFVFCLWHFFVGEHPEDREENTERQERIIF